MRLFLIHTAAYSAVQDHEVSLHLVSQKKLFFFFERNGVNSLFSSCVSRKKKFCSLKMYNTFSGHRSSGGGGGGYDHHNSVYGTYRRGGPRGHHGGGSGLNSSSHNEYNNFASSFEDEFDLKHFQQSLKSDLDSSPAAYQPPSQSQPRGLQHHAASR